MSLSSDRNGAEHPAHHQQGDGAVPAAVGVAVCSQEPVRPLAGPETPRGCGRTRPSAATRCPHQILTRHGLCCARQSTRQTQPCCLSSRCGARGAPTAPAGRYLGLDHPCLTLSSTEQCGGLQQDGNRQVLHFFLLHGVPFPPKPVTEASEAAVSAASLAPQRGRRAGSRCRPTHLLH